jgi:nitroimidazol reductase NimA-like FMN-containing flavoprotein (pyridoxamine 5'-phosphate oxidase superfamily)
MLQDARALEVLSRAECLTLLHGAQVGRAVFTVGALPAIVPVTFTVHDDAILMCTAADTRLAGAGNGQVLAFEVDELDPVTRTGWSVVVTGLAELVTNPAERSLVDAVVAPWVPGRRDVLIRVPFTVVAGRRIVAASSADAAIG